MNFLAHLILSGDRPELLVGNLMGDFVKGRLEGRFSPGIRAGLELHRGIDSFAHRNEIFSESKRRIAPSFGLYRGVLVDLFYDHFLAVHWDDYANEPLPRFLEEGVVVASLSSHDCDFIRSGAGLEQSGDLSNAVSDLVMNMGMLDQFYDRISR